MSQHVEIDVDQLIPMQDGFRRAAKTMRRMKSFVSQGGSYDQATLSLRQSGRTTPIVLTQFEDKRLFIHDGLHRVASIFTGRPSQSIRPNEYRIEEFTYAEYGTINTEAGYYTPFDPIREVRVASFHDFKSRAHQLVADKKDPTAFITENRHLYVRSRQAHHASVESLVRFYLPTL